MTEDVVRPGPRRLHPVLLLGLLAVPVLAVWFLLRPGYSAGLRWAGFTWAAVSLLLGVLARISIA